MGFPPVPGSNSRRDPRREGRNPSRHDTDAVFSHALRLSVWGHGCREWREAVRRLIRFEIMRRVLSAADEATRPPPRA